MGKQISPPPPRLLLTEMELCGWLGQAAPGDILEYHRGFLAADIDARSGCLPERDQTELVRLGRRAMRAAEIGRAHLVQRRHGPNDYSYLLDRASASQNPVCFPVVAAA